MTTQAVEERVEGLFQAIQNLVQIEVARAIHPHADFDDLAYFEVEDIDDDALARAELALKHKLLEIVQEENDAICNEWVS